MYKSILLRSVEGAPPSVITLTPPEKDESPTNGSFKGKASSFEELFLSWL